MTDGPAGPAGYSQEDKGRVAARLRRVGDALRRNKRLEDMTLSVIPRARIPIIKVVLGAKGIEAQRAQRAWANHIIHARGMWKP